MTPDQQEPDPLRPGAERRADSLRKRFAASTPRHLRWKWFWRQMAWPVLIVFGVTAAIPLSIMFLTGFRLWADPNAPAIVYADCEAVRAAGVEPIWRNEPGYAPRLDMDRDGRGCDPIGFDGWMKVIARDLGKLAGDD